MADFEEIRETHTGISKSKTVRGTPHAGPNFTHDASGKSGSDAVHLAAEKQYPCWMKTATSICKRPKLTSSGALGSDKSEGRATRRRQKCREMAELTNAIQKFFVENSRLKIPVIFHEECLHGHAAIDGTSFSQPIGLGATFDPELVCRLFEMTAEEARSRGTHQALTPVVDVAREPRWGRVEETYGEDPYLVACMGIAAVQGFQGNATFKDKKHIIATLKHFAAHGQPESGTNCAPVNVSERLLREVFLTTFKQAIQKGGAISVMASYNEIDGVPSHANKWLLRDVLRKEWGFAGFVVSDYFAIRELNERPELFGNHLAADERGGGIGRQSRRQHRTARPGLLLQHRRAGEERRSQGVSHR